MGRNGRKKNEQKNFRQRPETQKIAALPSDLDRAERLREILEALRQVNEFVPVVVEGKKDEAALKGLGFTGEILTIHRGKDIYDLSEELAEKYDKLVLLLDWDTHGEHLMRSLEENLSGHFEEFSPFREIIKYICQKDIKDIEGIPSLLRRLEGIAGISGITEYRKQD